MDPVTIAALVSAAGTAAGAMQKTEPNPFTGGPTDFSTRDNRVVNFAPPPTGWGGGGWATTGMPSFYGDTGSLLHPAGGSAGIGGGGSDSLLLLAALAFVAFKVLA